MDRIEYIGIKEFLSLRESLPLIDSRTPKEYALGHILNATNIAIFDNEERIIIGTLYKQKGKSEAILKSYELVGKKLRQLAETGIGIAKDKQVLMYCWRGGMRSYGFAWILSFYGLKVKVLKGGYKAYRRYLKEQMSNSAEIVILSGMTGSGKTEILGEMMNSGQQVIDLEKIARHKGSVFGNLTDEKQLPNEHFENILGETWLKLDLNKTIWIEDEGKSIGNNFIPSELFDKMRNAKVIKINVPIKFRIDRLLHDYSEAKQELLITSTEKITKRLGGQHAKAAIEAIRNNDLRKASEILLTYYDKAYQFGLSKRKPESIFELNLESNKPEINAQTILNFYKTLSNGRI